MLFKALNKTKLMLLLPLLTAISLLSFNGCDDSGVAPEGGGQTDTNVVIYNNLSVTYYIGASNDTLFLAINLLNGTVVIQDSSSKDMTIIDDPIGSNQNFYFRTGTAVVDAPGKSTWFYRLFSDATQAEFDTLSKIDYSGTLDSLDFTQEDTYGNGVWNYFNVPLQEKPIYSFYLKGKFLEGITNKPVYGMFYMKDSQPLSEHGGGSRFTIDVKINKNGEDKFVQ
jgi:hypothetical protein